MPLKTACSVCPTYMDIEAGQAERTHRERAHTMTEENNTQQPQPAPQAQPAPQPQPQPQQAVPPQPQPAPQPQPQPAYGQPYQQPMYAPAPLMQLTGGMKFAGEKRCAQVRDHRVRHLDRARHHLEPCDHRHGHRRRGGCRGLHGRRLPLRQLLVSRSGRLPGMRLLARFRACRLVGRSVSCGRFPQGAGAPYGFCKNLIARRASSGPFSFAMVQ